MKAIILLVFALAASVSSVSEPEGFVHWPADKLQGSAHELGPRIEPVEEGGLTQNLAWDMMGEFNNHYLYMIHRTESGTAELHEVETDFYIVQSGEGTVVVGGEMVDARDSAAGEVRGTSIRGGERTRLTAGDVVNIPAGIPHRVLVDPGKEITYVIVKIRD